MNESQMTSERSTELRADWFLKTYCCPDCGTEWEDEWSCMCNDRCPECDAEVEPVSSEDLSRPLSHDDYLGAARKIFGSETSFPLVTDQEAKNYAEAVMEGDPDRFECERMAWPEQAGNPILDIRASGDEQ